MCLNPSDAPEEASEHAPDTAEVYHATPDAEEAAPEAYEVTSAAAGRRLADREDVVRHKKRGYALINTTLTPHEAMVEDLLFVRDVLDRAEVPYLLVRGNDARPVIAVDWEFRKDLRRALVEACQDEPFYSLTVDARKDRALLVADGRLAESGQARMFRLYRPRLEPNGGLLYGRDTGVQVELWKWEGDLLHLPIENSLTRRTLPRNEAARGTVERFGRTWPTIENMFADHATDIDFEIDIVFSWVDGSDSELRAYRASFLPGVVLGEGDDAEARYRQINELKYALRSVHMFAPWINRIFICTDSKVPEWLDDSHERIMIVRAADHYKDRPSYRSSTRRPSSPSCSTSMGSRSTSSTRTMTCSSAGPSARTCSSPPAGSRSSSRRPPGSGWATTTSTGPATRTRRG